MILATAGTANAGKGIGGEYLEERFGVLRVSTGDMVRAVSRKLHGDVERASLIETANNLRKERGAGVLAELALEEYRDKQDQYSGLLIDGIRSIGEAEAVLKAGGHIIFIDAPKDIRWERAQDRNRDGEEQTLKQFSRNEEIELHGDGEDKTVINLLAIKALADVTITNRGSLGQYFADIEQYVQMASNRA